MRAIASVTATPVLCFFSTAVAGQISTSPYTFSPGVSGCQSDARCVSQGRYTVERAGSSFRCDALRNPTLIGEGCDPREL